MAKDKSKSKGKKKFKALEKGVSKGAKAVLDNVAPRVESILQPERDKVHELQSKAAAVAKPAVDHEAERLESAAWPVIDSAKAEFASIAHPVAERAESPAGESPSTESPVTIETPDDDAIYELAELFKAFADPTRLRILFALINGGKCVADISDAVGVSQSATSHQLRSMKQANLVKFKRLGKQVIYSLASENVKVMLTQGISEISE